MDKSMHTPRTRKNQNEYKDWEMKIILASDGNVTPEQLTHVLNERSKESISRKACLMGVKLKRKDKC